MRCITLSLLTIFFTSHAQAASQSLDCVNQDRSITLGAGNSDLETRIQYTDPDGKAAEYRGVARIFPDYDYNGASDQDQIVNALPISKPTQVSGKSETMKVTHKDGSVCYGRQRWDNHFTRTFLLTAKDNQGFPFYQGSKAPGLTEDRYLVAALRCRDYGFTTAGGCFVEDDSDKVEWINDKDLK